MIPTQTKIKRVSSFFRWLFLVLLIAVPIVHIISWISAPVPIDVSGKFGFLVSPVPKTVEVLHTLSLTTKIYGFLVTAIPVAVIEFILYFLIRLFKLYERGEIFTIDNVNYIKKTGIALLIMPLVRLISEGVVSAIVTWGNPIGSGTRKSVITLTGIDLSLLLTAFVIILISWIMAEGCRLREEQQLTV
jgi:hypothetical protein